MTRTGLLAIEKAKIGGRPQEASWNENPIDVLNDKDGHAPEPANDSRHR